MAIVTYPLNNITYDAEDVETYMCTRTSGVFSAEEHFSAEVTDLHEITIGPGLAWIRDEPYHGKSIYNSENVTLTISEADSASPRIDRIVLRFDKAANASELAVKTGEPGQNPVAPAVQQDSDIYELGLYEVYVGASTIALSAENITSTMMDESVCGIMSDSVTGVPTQELYDQFYAWFERVKGQLSDDPAGNLQNEIDNLREELQTKIQYGTSLPSTGEEGDIFLLIEG